MVPMIEIAEIKKLKDEEKLSFREISKRTGLARETVKKCYISRELPQYTRSKIDTPKSDVVFPYIKIWTEEDIQLIKKGKRKRIRPASTMFHDLLKLGIKVSESTVRRLVREIKPKEVFILLEYEPGVDMQIDWGELKLDFEDSESVKVYIFVSTLPYSNARFVYPYMKSDWLSFADGHTKAFEFFGGIPKRITYDNLSSAVKKILSGINRQEQDRMLHLKHFYGFETNYCSVGKGNEKGSVENGVGFAKRRFLGSNQKFKNWDHLIDHLSNACLSQL
jgi:transposase